MRIPEFTVVTENGPRYGADAIHACTVDGEPAVSFMCSGEQTTLPAEDVQRIEVRTPEGGGLCMTCLREGRARDRDEIPVKA